MKNMLEMILAIVSLCITILSVVIILNLFKDNDKKQDSIIDDSKILTCTIDGVYGYSNWSEEIKFKYNNDGENLEYYSYTRIIHDDGSSSYDYDYSNFIDTCNKFKSDFSSYNGLECSSSKTADYISLTMATDYTKIDIILVEDDYLLEWLTNPMGNKFSNTSTYNEVKNYFSTACNGFDNCDQYICK